MADTLISRLQAFTRLSKDDIAALRRIERMKTREIHARRDLIREGDRPHYICVILEGWACRYKTLPDGRRQIVGFFLPGDLCDLHVYILKEMDHNVGSITTLKVAEVSRDEMDRLIDERPRVTQALFWNELVTVAIQREWTLNIGQRSAYERLAHLLCELFLRLETVGLTRGNRCNFPLTQTDLADATGLTAVHVNRTLQELRANGLVELRGRELHVPDMRALRSAAMFNDNYLHLRREGANLDAND